MEQAVTRRENSGKSKLSLWNIEEQYYLPIMAVCFSAGEIRHLSPVNGANHKSTCCLVELMEVLISQITKDRSFAAIVQTKLDSKYCLTVRRFDELSREDDAGRLWDFYWKSGNFRGALWAIMQNGLLSRNFKAKILQQIEITSLRNCFLFLKDNGNCYSPNKGDEFAKSQTRELQHRTQQIRELKSELFLKEYQIDKLKRQLVLHSRHTNLPI